MQRYYNQGFIDKCAEYGVDPEALVKEAQVPAVISKTLNAGGASRLGRLANWFSNSAVGRKISPTIKTIGRNFVGKDMYASRAASRAAHDKVGEVWNKLRSVRSKHNKLRKLVNSGAKGASSGELDNARRLRGKTSGRWAQLSDEFRGAATAADKAKRLARGDMATTYLTRAGVGAAAATPFILGGSKGTGYTPPIPNSYGYKSHTYTDY